MRLPMQEVRGFERPEGVYLNVNDVIRLGKKLETVTTDPDEAAAVSFIVVAFSDLLESWHQR